MNENPPDLCLSCLYLSIVPSLNDSHTATDYDTRRISGNFSTAVKKKMEFRKLISAGSLQLHVRKISEFGSELILDSYFHG